MNISSYPKIYNLGHTNISEIFEDEVEISEKADGSQFRACVVNIDNNTLELRCFSKNAQINIEDPNDLFRPAVKTFIDLYNQNKLTPGWIYCGESICRPRHNFLEYDRAPKGGVILFDIIKGINTEDYVRHAELEQISNSLDLECVPLLYKGKITSEDQLKELLKNDSILGKVKVEGVVFKNYTRFGRDKKPLFGKLVREDFKEKQKKQWKKDNPGQGDIILQIIEALKTEARWNKAIQHLREEGKIEHSPRDIGLLIKEIQKDTFEEETEWIKNKLFQWAQSKIKRGITGGFPEYYKDLLTKKQFEEKDDKNDSSE